MDLLHRLRRRARMTTFRVRLNTSALYVPWAVLVEGTLPPLSKLRIV